MVISKGERVHIVTRRLFKEDLRRHFSGMVEEVAGGIIRVTGYTFCFDEVKGEFIRRDGKRTRLFGLGDAGLIIIVLPEAAEIEHIRYGTGENGDRMITDGRTFEMNISEFGGSR